MDFIEIDKYTAVKLEDGGQYGFKLIEGYVNQAGEFKPSFCKRQFGKDKPEKTVPVSVKLGDRKHAEAALKLLLSQVEVPF